MDHYILRIYRRGESSPEDITGIADEVETGEKKVFRSCEELIRILIPGGECEAAKREKKTGLLPVGKRKAGQHRKEKK